MRAVSYARVQVSLVHEWLTNRAGSEQCVASMRRAYPGASVSTTVWWEPEFPGWDPHTSVLQRFATGPSAHVHLLPLLPAAWRTVEVPDADLVISSFHTFSLRARVPAGVPHLAYCYTPPRFLWQQGQMAGERGLASRSAIKAAGAVLRPGDLRRSKRPDVFVAISEAVRDRIQHAYQREAPVVHPPVALERFTPEVGTPKGDYHLMFGRVVPYKRVDLAIAAFAELGWPLVVAGDGRQRAELEASAPPNVTFTGRVDDEDLPGLLAGARGLIFPNEEDFGIIPVEANAAGTPVVAYAVGGALDTITEGETGVFFHEQTPAAVAEAVRRAAAVDWDGAAISAATQRFSEARFHQGLAEAVSSIT